jgi:hypothetical protein
MSNYNSGYPDFKVENKAAHVDIRDIELIQIWFIYYYKAFGSYLLFINLFWTSKLIHKREFQQVIFNCHLIHFITFTITSSKFQLLRLGWLLQLAIEAILILVFSILLARGLFQCAYFHKQSSAIREVWTGFLNNKKATFLESKCNQTPMRVVNEEPIVIFQTDDKQKNNSNPADVACRF